jgi:membrane-associated phospholipid phosphatase
MMKKPLSIYITAYVVLLVVTLGLLFTYPKLELHLLMNSCHTAFLDTFFKYFSVLAEWPLYVLALLPLLWKKYRMTLFFGLSELFGGALVQILKHLFTMERPASAFERCPDLVLPLVQGVELHHSNSFPSGHTSTFFMFCTCCALLLVYHYQVSGKLNNRRTLLWVDLAMVGLLALAVLGGYSRVYLSQHFLMDVSMGSFIGVVTPCVLFYFLRDKWLKPNPEPNPDHDEKTVA